MALIRINRLVLGTVENLRDAMEAFGVSLLDNRPIRGVVLTGWDGQLNKYEAAARVHVLSLRRVRGIGEAEAVEVDALIVETDSAGTLQTNWSARHGEPLLRFRILDHPGVRGGQWDYVEQIDGAEFNCMPQEASSHA